MEYEKKLSAAKHALELAETEQAKEKSEKESCQNKILDLEHSQAQLTEKIEKHEAELEDLKLKVTELEKSHQDDLRSYQRMVEGFLKAFKSETRRILLTQKSDLDFSKLEKVTPNNLAKVAAEEEAAKKSASKQRKGQKVKKKAASEKPSAECPKGSSLLPKRVSVEMDLLAENVALVSDDHSLTITADVSRVTLKSGIDVDVQFLLY